MFAKGRILIIDDEPLVLDMFQSFFSRQNFDVSTACCAKEALDLAQVKNFDIIFCDVILNESNGIDLLQQVQRYNKLARLIIVTGSPNPADLARANKLNAAYLSKPVSFDEVIETINCSRSENSPTIA